MSRSVAISEILILMIVSAVIGWLIARWITSSNIEQLRENLLTKSTILENCFDKKHSYKQSELPVVATGRDNLKVIEGIGPKIEELLNSNGVTTFGHLAQTDMANIQYMLQRAGAQFRMHDPTTWREQSALARDGKWDELGDLQEKLDGGKIV